MTEPKYVNWQTTSRQFVVVDGGDWQCLCILSHCVRLLQTDRPSKVFTGLRETIHQWLEFLLGVGCNCYVIRKQHVSDHRVLFSYLWGGRGWRALIWSGTQVDPFCCCVKGIFQQQSKEKSKEHGNETAVLCNIPFMPVWIDSAMLCSFCWKPISGRTWKRPSLLQVKWVRSSYPMTAKDIYCSLYFFWSCQMEKTMSTSSFQLGSQTLCKPLDVDHDERAKTFSTMVKRFKSLRTEISVRRKWRSLRPNDGEVAGMN